MHIYKPYIKAYRELKSLYEKGRGFACFLPVSKDSFKLLPQRKILSTTENHIGIKRYLYKGVIVVPKLT